MRNLKKYLSVSPEVQEAIAAGKPVVALESTIISHGMPYPQNVETALNVEKIIRENGAVPATIALIQGKITVGCSPEQIEYLGKKGLAVTKASRRDLPVLLMRGEDGATTVTTTMIGAALAGIRVFATGGIGGVHMGAETSFDISADLEELGRTPVIVVSAGAKAILDIEKTLEVLETKGVPVVVHGADVLPAFWSRQSHLKAPLRLDTPEAIARFQATRSAIGVNGGMLIANPIPLESEIPADIMGGYIREALSRATKNGITGKAVTPYLLSEILDITKGESLKANIALVENNARLAARIAVALTLVR